MNLSRTFIWRKLREYKILKTHRRVAGICESLIAEYQEHPVHFDLSPKAHFDTDRIIWQYWAQGYDDVPPVVRRCLDSIDKYATNYTIIRLTDANLSDYLDLPDFVQQKRTVYSRAFFSDLLKLLNAIDLRVRNITGNLPINSLQNSRSAKISVFLNQFS